MVRCHVCGGKMVWCWCSVCLVLCRKMRLVVHHERGATSWTHHLRHVNYCLHFLLQVHRYFDWDVFNEAFQNVLHFNDFSLQDSQFRVIDLIKHRVTLVVLSWTIICIIASKWWVQRALSAENLVSTCTALKLLWLESCLAFLFGFPTVDFSVALTAFLGRFMRSETGVEHIFNDFERPDHICLKS